MEDSINTGPSGVIDPRPDGGWELTVVGSLLESTGLHFPATHLPEETKTIFGKTGDGFAISILNARCIRVSPTYIRNEALQGASEEVWVFDTYAKGEAHVHSSSRFTEIAVAFGNLKEWSNLPIHEPDVEQDGANSISRPQSMTYSTMINEANISLERRWRLRTDDQSYRYDLEVNFRIVAEMDFGSVRTSWIHPLRQLLRFLTLDRVRVSCIEAIYRVKDTDDNTIRLRTSLFLSEPHSDDIRSKQLSWPRMLAPLMRLHMLNVDFGYMLYTWFEFYALNDSVVDSFLASSDPELSPDSQAQLLSKSLEGIHARYIGGTSRDPDVHDRIVATVDEAITGSDLNAAEKNWVKSRVGSNQKGFKRQINEIIEKAESTGVDIQASIPDFSELVNSVRQKTSHHYPDRSFEHMQMTMISSIGIRWLLRHIYLREMGVCREQTTSLVQECFTYRSELRYVKSFFGAPET